MTDDTLQKLKEAFLRGCSDREACLYAGIAPTTLYNYQLTHPEYVEQKESWKENPILIARESVLKGVRQDPNLALKFLQGKRREEFATKTEVEQSGGITVNIVRYGDAEAIS